MPKGDQSKHIPSLKLTLKDTILKQTNNSHSDLNDEKDDITECISRRGSLEDLFHVQSPHFPSIYEMTSISTPSSKQSSPFLGQLENSS